MERKVNQTGRRFRWAAMLCLTLMAAGCGGGGDEASAPGNDVHGVEPGNALPAPGDASLSTAVDKPIVHGPASVDAAGSTP
jgi:hypothetical protein